MVLYKGDTADDTLTPRLGNYPFSALPPYIPSSFSELDLPSGVYPRSVMTAKLGVEVGGRVHAADPRESRTPRGGALSRSQSWPEALVPGPPALRMKHCFLMDFKLLTLLNSPLIDL